MVLLETIGSGSLQVHCWGTEKLPGWALVVGDVSLNLIFKVFKLSINKTSFANGHLWSYLVMIHWGVSASRHFAWNLVFFTLDIFLRNLFDTSTKMFVALLESSVLEIIPVCNESTVHGLESLKVNSSRAFDNVLDTMTIFVACSIWDK